MSKSDDRKLEALAKKNAAKAAKAKEKVKRRYDDTLLSDEDDDAADARKLFNEMKKREF
ncbi:MAG: hypothetical protein PVF27_10300 [Gemmatimonadales bacterium]|jgi:hypothetical protein